MNLRIARLVLWIDDQYSKIDNTLARYSITAVQSYFLVGLYGALLIIAGHPLGVLGLPWFALAAYRYFY